MQEEQEEAQERILEQIQELLNLLNLHRRDGLTYQVALLPEEFDPEQAIASLELERGAIQWLSEPPPEAELIAQAIATWEPTPAPCPCGRMTILDCKGECN